MLAITKAPMPIEIVALFAFQAVLFLAKVAIYAGAACFVVDHAVNKINQD